MKPMQRNRVVLLILILGILVLVSCARKSDEELILESALEISEDIERSIDKETVLLMIADGYAKIRQYDKVFEIAEGITDTLTKEYLFWGLSQSLAEDGKFSKAIEMTNLIKEGKIIKAQALRDIAVALAEDGQYDFALCLPDSIPDSYLRTWTLAEIARVSFENERHDRALMILAGALNFAKSIDEQGSRNVSLGKVANGYAAILEFDKALSIADLMQDGKAKARTWIKIADECIDSGDSALAITVLSRLHDFVGGVKNQEDIDAQEFLASIGESFFVAGEHEKAIEIIRSIDREIPKIRPLVSIGRDCKKRGKIKKAREYFDEAFSTTEGIDDEFDKVLAMTILANEYAQADERERANAVLEKAFQNRGNLKEGYHRETGLYSIAYEYVAIGKYEKALLVCGELKAKNQTIILADIAQQQIEGGRELSRKERRMIKEIVANEEKKRK